MAWKEKTVFEQRKQFINDHLSDSFSVSELCRIYDISRPTGYLWIKRYKEGKEEGLVDRKSTPHHYPRATSAEIIDEILKVKYMRITWGPKKIIAYLKIHKPHIILPSTTTVGNILNKNGLVMQRKLRLRFAKRTHPLAHAKEINDVWSVDFKGGFMTNDNYKCEPFTLTDNASRFLLKCLCLDYNNTDHVWAVLDIAFREYGLPLNLRSDNGPPFASRGIGRLSQLSVQLIKAGVMPDFIDPGKPEQNGRHERMHGTLKSEFIFPELNLKEQKMKLDEFQNYYNFERPHEGINQLTPGSIYERSERVWRGKFKPPEYPDSFKKAKVRGSGQIKFKGKDIFIGRTLLEEYVGLEEGENGFKVYYGPIYLADINLKGELNISRREGRIRNKKFNKVVY
jgi:putative transposase